VATEDNAILAYPNLQFFWVSIRDVNSIAYVP
jgi:hypothetical protein